MLLIYRFLHKNFDNKKNTDFFVYLIDFYLFAEVKCIFLQLGFTANLDFVSLVPN